ncbi:MAG: Crp/Fnr family transcriptional regulator [Bacteroidota bacterium]|nr:Crp/Fnr family transcriptional regulator [Bacteroidota bacterium]
MKNGNESLTCEKNHCFLCSNTIPEWKEIIAAKKKMVRFKKGETIFKEGEKVTGIYFLYEGAAKVHKQWIEEKELIIRFTREGDILGHRGLASGDTYPVSATALTESKACFISSSFLETLLKTDHSFSYRLLQFYAQELQKAEMRMRNLALMEVKGRIAETLLELLQVYGTNKEGFISMAITRQDIAAYSGSTYETVFKFLKTLEISNLVAVSGKSIKINDPAALKKIADHSH